MIGFASWEMREELSQLWQVCFLEKSRPANYFFNNAFRPENCLVYCMGGHAAAMLHILPAQLVQAGKEPVQAQYVFACATLPKYRSHGFMHSLLAYAGMVGAERGDRYSFLLPAEPSLYSFYEKAEYQEFFKMRIWELNRSQMQTLAGDAVAHKVLFTAEQMNQIRTQNIKTKDGSVLWDDRAVWFAAGSHVMYGGKLVCAGNSAAGAYALCRSMGDVCEATEWMTQPEGNALLAAQVLHEFPAAKTFRIRLPAWEALSVGKSTSHVFGVVKPLGGYSMEVFASGAPYLGLAMD